MRELPGRGLSEELEGSREGAHSGLGKQQREAGAASVVVKALSVNLQALNGTSDDSEPEP